MAKVICQNCGAEVILPEHSEVCIGTTISEESKGNYILPTKNATNNTVKENKENGTMRNTEFTMELLAKMVADQIKNSGEFTNIMINGTSSTASKVVANGNINDSTVEDRNGWAKGSNLYGKEICGYVYNPYMVRYWIVKNYMEVFNAYEGNVSKGLTAMYDYNYSIRYVMKEISKLAMLEKRDQIAYDERKLLFTAGDCRIILVDYLNKLKKYINDSIEFETRRTKPGQKVGISVKGRGYIAVGIVKEIVENHRVKKSVVRYSDEINAILLEIDNLMNELNRVNLFYVKKPYKKLEEIMSTFKYIKIRKDTKKYYVFMDCFIKSGAYYTLKSKVMFENLAVKNDDGESYTGREALQYLRKLLEEEKAGYVFHAILKLSLNRYC